MKFSPLPAILVGVSCTLKGISAYNLLSGPGDLQPTKKYDYIVAGGGTAVWGSVLAARLSEDPNNTVLVVEAGGRVEDDAAVAIPFLGPSLSRTIVDWNYTTVPQRGFANRNITFERGHVLGGSSCINIMTYHRGSNDMWDNWANLTGDDSLSWSAVEKYYLKNSRLVPSADGHNTTGQTDPSAHGYGPIEVSVSGYPYDLDDRIVAASKALGTFSLDLNAGEALGTSWMQSAVGGGKRSCASFAYLVPLEGSRANLDVLINTHVTRLKNSGPEATPLDLRMVELGQRNSSASISVMAEKEVILSAGVVGTPHILMLSGVGPKAQVEALGIEPLLDVPELGSFLTDHPVVPMYFELDSNDTYDALLINKTLLGAALQEWDAVHQGPLVDTSSGTVAYSKLDPSGKLVKRFGDPANGPRSGNLEQIYGVSLSPPRYALEDALTPFLTSPALLHSGNISLASTDPFEPPLINPGYLTHDFDKEAIIQCMTDSFEFIKTPPLAGYVGKPLYGLSSTATDEDLLSYVQKVGTTENHSCMTARMSPAGSNFGVVDPDHRLKGAKGLRIVDASVFPQIPNVHPQAVVYILAERAAELIRTLVNGGVDMWET
ncbi:Pyranose dehydrogenase [Cytospora mali]|uniref:Pyranose dehydrogenase n=1 Tax=Cytospora mali TaxID=578113 RepID=A0A194UW39_CYTMA|nr:Pyranose dehydrogenase [Valsa mali var. pyri (nom. inval.)]